MSDNREVIRWWFLLGKAERFVNGQSIELTNSEYQDFVLKTGRLERIFKNTQYADYIGESKVAVVSLYPIGHNGNES